MKKSLLLCAAALFSMMASAGDGLTAEGANVILLPSSYWDNDIEWKAWTWVYNSGQSYGDWNTDNPNYNMVVGAPEPDAEGREWYEPGFDMGPKEDDKNFDVFDEEGNPTPIVWEEHTAPFSSDNPWNGRTSYQWTTGSIMADIYVRRTFTTDRLLAGPVYLACGHDDAPCEYFLNGDTIFARTGYETNENGNIINGWNNAEYILLTDEQKALIKLGGEENVLAFHVHQNWGGAFADCGLYTKAEGGLDMGYSTPWEGKVLFNNTGGYNRDGRSPSNNPKHPWSALYEAQEGDVYSFVIPGHSTEEDPWMQQLHFKTPIRIQEDHSYSFKAKLEADKPFSTVIVKLTDNDDDDIELAYEEFEINTEEPTEVEMDFSGMEVSNFKVAFDFGGGEDSTKVTIKEMSLIDTDDDNNELWVGTHYFNFISMNNRIEKYLIWDEDLNDGEGGYRDATEDEKEWAELEVSYELADAPEIEGRVETLAWTQADFDDSMWDEQMMPTGSAGYMSELQTIWPSGILEDTERSSNYWIRRNFELDKINDRLSYELNVCHDDVYETYVNGHLLQKNVGWTNGKNPVQVHIPAKYLNVGKNVIATYIQQNWGGYFYDCGINVTEVNYEECVKLFNDALAYAQTDTLLTNRMHADVQAIIDEAKQAFEENKNDPAEIRNLARELTPAVNAIFAYSSSVKTLKDTYDICTKLEDKGYWGTALTDVAAALDTCATASQLNPFITALRDARKATAMERHTENYKGSVPEATSMENAGLQPADDPELPRYYIYNVGAKNFLGGGEAWGAHMALEYISNPMMILQATSEVLDEDGEPTGEEAEIEGAYYIETFRPNGSYGEMDFLGWNGFVDVSRGNNLWEIIPVEGKENVYYIAQYGQTFPTVTTTTEEGEEIVTGGGKKLLGLRGDNGDNIFAPSYYLIDTDCKSPELETNQWMFITREELLSFIATASETNPVDLSFLIDNPGYDQRWSIDNWMFTNGSVFGRGANHSNFVLESYNSDDFDNSQDIWPEEEDKALPAGTYVLSVQGYYRDGIEQKHVEKVLAGEQILERALIYAGPSLYYDDPDFYEGSENTIPLMPIHIEANKVPGIGFTFGGLSMPGTYNGQPFSACDQAATEYFPCGLYQNKLAFTIPEDDPGHLSIGINKAYSEERLGGDWIVMDNWRLKYYGNQPINDPDAIKGIVSDEINRDTKADKGIYNLLGQKMSKTQRGVNIVGGKKIIKK
ncbi:MAG: hypothetical protein IJ615_02105 [Bacteroidaceae bacterium]|nr:hypothetical protein [Bacteroidaceae bacterium]